MFVVAIVQKNCGGHCKIFVVAIVQFSFVVATVQGVSPEVRDMPPPWAPKPSRKKDLRVFWVLEGIGAASLLNDGAAKQLPRPPPGPQE